MGCTASLGSSAGFDRLVLSSAQPSNHTPLHHAAPQVLTRTNGGILIVWDRLFGTYIAEDDTGLLYGTSAAAQLEPAVGEPANNSGRHDQASWRALIAGGQARVWFKHPGCARPTGASVAEAAVRHRPGPRPRY